MVALQGMNELMKKLRIRGEFARRLKRLQTTLFVFRVAHLFTIL